MNANNAKEYLPLVQALAEGKTIQAKCQVVVDSSGWRDCEGDISFHGLAENYRIKPEPREIWVNEYPEGDCHTHSSAESAAQARGANRNAITRRYREVIE